MYLDHDADSSEDIWTVLVAQRESQFNSPLSDLLIRLSLLELGRVFACDLIQLVLGPLRR